MKIIFQHTAKYIFFSIDFLDTLKANFYYGCKNFLYKMTTYNSISSFFWKETFYNKVNYNFRPSCP